MVPFLIGLGIGIFVGAAITFWAATSFIRDVIGPEQLKKYYDRKNSR